MVYKGPNIVNMIKNDLCEKLLKEGVKNFTEIVGNKSKS
jgi:dihydroorotate dehydrogenase